MSSKIKKEASVSVSLLSPETTNSNTPGKSPASWVKKKTTKNTNRKNKNASRFLGRINHISQVFEMFSFLGAKPLAVTSKN